jgi:hypothetical protein
VYETNKKKFDFKKENICNNGRGKIIRCGKTYSSAKEIMKSGIKDRDFSKCIISGTLPLQ